jgi:hypothetical protein
VTWVLYLGLGLIGVSTLSLFGVVFVRLNQLIRERWQYDRSLFWSNWIEGLISEDELPESLPKKSREDFMMFLSQWVQEVLKEESVEKLTEFARRINLAQTIISLYPKVSFNSQLVILTSLGLLSQRSAWMTYQEALRDANSLKTLVAMRSMLQTHERRALGEIIEELKHARLPKNRSLQVLSLTSRKKFQKFLINSLNEASNAEQENLIEYLELAEPETARPWLIDRLKNDPDSEISANCLRVLEKVGTVDEIPLIKTFVNHDVWYVRVRALHTLGTIKMVDVTLFLKKLEDENWWVRRAAAMNLVRSSERSPEELESYLETIDDQYGREALKDILSEERLES